MRPLEGVVVLDLSRYIAGPTASMMLADQGADVIKVEPLPGGDPSRQSGPFMDGGESVYFMSANRNKRSLAVDLRSAEGLSAVQRIAAGCDVLIENFKPGTVSRMGLSYSDLAPRNPGLVHCSISGFGSGAAGSTMAGFDQNAQGMSGFMSVTGTAETGPLRAGIPVADSSTGLVAGFAILAKLFEKAHTGVGGQVSTSLMQTMTFMMTYQAQKYLSLGIVPTMEGNDHPLIFPQGTFRTRDGHVTIASGNQQMWEKLAAVLGLDDLLRDARFSTNEVRLDNRVQLRKLMEEQLAGKNSADWISIINRAGIPCGPVLAMDCVFNHPLARELELTGSVHHSTLGDMLVLGRPADTGDAPWLHSAPPVLGEHSQAVLADHGFSEAEIAEYTRRGIIAQG
ncbi:CaiB/BaiF CoA transferase family protein [Arthrobacter sunyaminii]|uniref:CoA transferase n=1 Tax=Arthrobacter sunyaminii TaxID=2816859 RepID=A0A975S694_9MICC|nr:CoA transferase [Arthrobacter sunyaminii]MBO0909795.1 CoA transferase [Arthrobacter sunyaminii]QWQ36586.1 CoA transferase [Arthrobacter sunyaminii]